MKIKDSFCKFLSLKVCQDSLWSVLTKTCFTKNKVARLGTVMQKRPCLKQPPVAGPMRASASTGNQDLSDRPQELGVPGMHQSTHSDQGGHLAGSAMGSQSQAVRLGDLTGHTHAADAEAADSIARSCKGEGPDPQLPQPQAVDGQDGERGALESASDAAQSRSMVDPTWTSPFFVASAFRPVWPGRCIAFSLSLCTTSRLAPWIRGESNRG